MVARKPGWPNLESLDPGGRMPIASGLFFGVLMDEIVTGTGPFNDTASTPASDAGGRIDSLAGRSPLAWLRFIGVVIAGVATDLTTKAIAFRELGPQADTHQVVVIPHVLMFQTTLNNGAVFGIGQGLALLFILMSLVAIAFVVYVFMSSYRWQWPTHIALGLILAGAMGNMYDRVFNHGGVRDFILLHYWPWIFNVADAMLCIGVPMLIFCWRFQRPPPR